jgi:hypothetical protein
MNGTSVRVRVPLLFAFALLVAPGLSGCAAPAAERAAWTAAPAAQSSSGMADAMQAAWANRPAYVRSDGRTEEAYAYAAAHPEILQWIPCYCGCAGMGHRSNLDCFFKPTNGDLTGPQFEEHASGCQVCVDEALMAKQLAGQGQSLRAIRSAIDQAFGGGGAPGTSTELPPA